MFERQNSNSRINVLVTMDDNVTTSQVVPTCKHYDNLPTFVFDDMAFGDPSSDVKMAGAINFTESGSASFAVTTKTEAMDAANTNINESLIILNALDRDIPKKSTGLKTDVMMSFPANLDPRLLDVTKEALLNGSLTPLIKEELKYSIQSKRLKEGKQEMKVEFTEPEPDQLTAEDLERVEKRKVQNRLAARRFRDKQKNIAERLQKKCEQMETEQTLLRHELQQIKKERDQLKQLWIDHMSLCPWNDTMPLFLQQSQTNDT